MRIWIWIKWVWFSVLVFNWRVRYAFIMWRRIRPTIKALWINAGEAWIDNQGIDTPPEAVNNVLDWEGSSRQWNAEVDKKKAAKAQRRAEGGNGNE